MRLGSNRLIRNGGIAEWPVAQGGPAAACGAEPVAALVLAGMNDVLNSQGYTQAASWSRLRVGAWVMIILVAIGANFSFGYSERRDGRTRLMLLPLIVSVPLFLIADIDTPRGGVIRVVPQNLIALTKSFAAQ